MRFVLKECCGGEQQLSGEVEIRNGQLEIRLNGYGDATSSPGYGVPILLELRENSPTLVVWSDITEQDPTHQIDLSAAKEPANHNKEED